MHFPYCRSKCSYCAFVSSPDLSSQSTYLQRLKAEIAERGNGVKADTIYFGGGTPSVMGRGMLSEVYRSLCNAFDLSELNEFTVEANPESVTEELLAELSGIGVSRVSMGLQSADDNVLKAIGRPHDLKRFIKAARAVKSAGIKDLSSDLIIGLPGQGDDDIDAAARIFDSLGIDHVSIYALTVEEGTPLFTSGYTADNDREADMYYKAVETLASYGYSRYEVSNFARNGKIAVHNCKYWTGADYYGFGAAAHSLVRGVRRENTDSLDAYLAGRTLKDAYELSSDDRRMEFIMLRLRTSEGIDFSEYEHYFGSRLENERAEQLKKLLSYGVVKIDNDKLSLTDKGFYLLDSVVTELL